MIANNAYTLLEHLLIPYSGADKKDKSKDAYNFYIFAAAHSNQTGIWFTCSQMADFQEAIGSKIVVSDISS